MIFSPLPRQNNGRYGQQRRRQNPTTRMSASPRRKRFCRPDDARSERAVQMALAGHGRQVSSLLTPVAWMFVIAALLIALDSATGVGVLVLLQRGIDSGVAAGDMSTIGICALLALCLVAIGWCCYALQTIFAARAAESVQHTVRLRSFSHLLRLSLPGTRSTSTRVLLA